MGKGRKFKRSMGPFMQPVEPLKPRQMVCWLCGEAGGTLVKDGDAYKHQNPSHCAAIRRERHERERRKKADEYVKKLKEEKEE